MSYVILTRNPNSRTVFGIAEGDNYNQGGLAEYATEDEAEEAAKNITACKVWPYVIVEAP